MSNKVQEPDPERESLQRREVRERWLVIASIGAAFGAIGGLVIGYLTVRSYDQQLVIMQNQYVSLQQDSVRQNQELAAVKEQADAAKIQAADAHEAAKHLSELVLETHLATVNSLVETDKVIAADNARSSDEQRARISTVEAHLVPKLVSGQNFILSLRLQNTGHETATNFRMAALDGPWRRGFLSKPEEFNAETQKSCQRLKLYNDLQDRAPGSWTIDTPVPWNSKLQDIVDGTAVEVFNGCISYVTRGNNHKTGFCYYYDLKESDHVTNHMQPCPGGFFTN
jgi:hypothetical protein